MESWCGRERKRESSREVDRPVGQERESRFSEPKNPYNERTYEKSSGWNHGHYNVINTKVQIYISNTVQLQLSVKNKRPYYGLTICDDDQISHRESNFSRHVTVSITILIFYTVHFKSFLKTSMPGARYI